ncbi:MAG: zinc ribbon domain-containing protein [Candidatus Heimdallarchaeota archaeon]
MKIKKKPVTPLCQSCGLPTNTDERGSEQDGTFCDDYCNDCYENGQFIEPEITLKEMIESSVPSTIKSRNMTTSEARDYLRILLPTLKRWRSSSPR